MSGLRYERPGTVAEATALLAAGGGAARVLAGGTDLAIALRGGLNCEVLVDVKHIPELGRIAWT
ncbi:MAG TPA: FAD binding domain-containing protein, partial [Thermoanaerobaculaceae bacterium]|nr:FAD binding domain-containing protein [Thermoanaerobaculaceae bacterium]